LGSATLKSIRLNDASRLHGGQERNDEFVEARHFIEVASDKRKRESYLIEDVFVVKVTMRFVKRDEAWEFAYDLAGWARAEQPGSDESGRPIHLQTTPVKAANRK
jgi:hypothetical protein